LHNKEIAQLWNQAPAMSKNCQLVCLAATLLFFLTALIGAVRGGAEVMVGQPALFEFNYFENLNLSGDGRAVEAKRYLTGKYPSGSDVRAGVGEMTQAGATCEHIIDRGDYYVCRYGIPGFFRTEWIVAFKVEAGTNRITDISVERGIDGL
jgi:hypothetical protein